MADEQIDLFNALDGAYGRPPGKYLDVEANRLAEYERAKVEGREPEEKPSASYAGIFLTEQRHLQDNSFQGSNLGTGESGPEPYASFTPESDDATSVDVNQGTQQKIDEGVITKPEGEVVTSDAGDEVKTDDSNGESSDSTVIPEPSEGTNLHAGPTPAPQATDETGNGPLDGDISDEELDLLTNPDSTSHE